MMSKPNALIVDDDTETQKIFELVLQNVGYATTQAYTVDEALEYLEDTTPRLILLDMMLPGKTGLELLKYIRAHADLQHIYVIFISAHAFEAHELGQDAQPNLILRKPIRIPDLKDAVTKALA